MIFWDRFDICEAFCVLEWDYNIGGWLRERPSNQRRMESIGVQLNHMTFKPHGNLEYDTLTENGQAIYDDAVTRLGLPRPVSVGG